MDNKPESIRYQWDVEQLAAGMQVRLTLRQGDGQPLQVFVIPQLAIPALRVALAKHMEPIMAALALELGGVLQRVVEGRAFPPAAPPSDESPVE